MRHIYIYIYIYMSYGLNLLYFILFYFIYMLMIRLDFISDYLVFYEWFIDNTLYNTRSQYRQF